MFRVPSDSDDTFSQTGSKTSFYTAAEMENDERMGGGLDGPANNERARALALLSADPAYLRNALRAQGLDIVERGAGNVPPPLAPAPAPIADAYCRPRAVC